MLLFLVLTIIAFFVLRSRSFHNRILSYAQEQASASLGVQVEARDFAVHLSKLSLDLYGVTVHGAPPYANPPLLQVDHVGLGVRIVSILHQSWYLNDVAIDRPVAQLFVDRDGKNNLPNPKSSGQSNTSIFDLAVRHVLMDRGEVYYNNRKSTLTADLHDVTFRSGFDPAQKKYSGTLSYRKGRVQLENFNPLISDFNAPFTATPTTFTVDHATLQSEGSQIVVNATMHDYVNPQVQAQYSAVLNAGEFRRITKNETLPTGVVNLAGTLQFASDPKKPMIDTLAVQGEMNSRALNVQNASFHGAITDIVAKYVVANRNLDIHDLSAHLLGGTLTANMIMRDITGASQSKLQANLRGVSLAGLKNMMNAPAMRQVSLGGTVNADAIAAWGKTLDNLTADTNATINASAAPIHGGSVVPLNGVIHAHYAAASQQIGLRDSYLHTPQTAINLNGTVSRQSSLAVRMQSNDLHELETISEMFRTPTPGQPATPLGLYGTASFNGAVQGSTANPRLTGQLTASNLRVRGSSWRVLRTNVDLSPSQASLQNADLEPATRGRITFNLSAGLRQWSFTESSPINLTLNASQLNVGDLEKLAGSQAPVSGTLSANLAVHGSQLNPVGQGTVSLTQARISGEPVQSATLKFQGTGNEVHGTLGVRLTAGAADAQFSYLPRQRGYDVKLKADGIQLDQLATVKARNMDLHGVVNLDASGRGTLDDPQLTASLAIPKLVAHGQNINGVTLKTDVANHVANIVLDSQAIGTTIRGRGTVNLTGDYYTQATLDTAVIPFQPLLAVYAPSQAANLSGQTELHATLRGPLKNKSALDAHAVIPTLQVNYKDTVKIGAAQPIHIDYANGVLSLQRTTIRGTDTDLQLQASIPTASNGPMSLLALGTIDLQIAQLFSPDITSSGQLKFDINSLGSRSDLAVKGQVQIVNASFASGELPIGLQNGNGTLTLTNDRVNITSFEGTMGGGKVTASGGVIYDPSLRFDVAVSGRGIRMLYPDTVREGMDANLALTGSMDSALLSGQVRIDQLSFTPGFDLTEFIGQLSGGTTPAPSQGFSQNLQLNIGVESTTGVNLVSRTLSIQGGANLQVRGTAADPVILGRVNLTGGDLIFRGNRYVLQGGTLDFVNPVQTQPVVNVAVNTTIQQYNIQLRFWGPMDQLHTNYASDPALPPSDIINLLAFGKTSEASAANPTPGNLGAESAIASQVSGQVTSRLEKIAGISQLSIDPVLGGNTGQQNPGARITVQQRVTSNLFVTFASDVTSTQNQTISVQYKVSPKVSVSGTRDQNGGFGFDTRIHKSW